MSARLAALPALQFFSKGAVASTKYFISRLGVQTIFFGKSAILIYIWNLADQGRDGLSWTPRPSLSSTQVRLGKHAATHPGCPFSHAVFPRVISTSPKKQGVVSHFSVMTRLTGLLKLPFEFIQLRRLRHLPQMRRSGRAANKQLKEHIKSGKSGLRKKCTPFQDGVSILHSAIRATVYPDGPWRRSVLGYQEGIRYACIRPWRSARPIKYKLD